jgi:heparosan-N-sulfate-glucuronate 5-epimerase
MVLAASAAMVWQVMTVMPAAAAGTAAIPAVTPNQSLVAGYTFHPVGPVRILDSRIPLNASIVRSDVPEAIQIAGKSGVPADAVAIAGTLTIADPTHSGYVALTPVQATANSIATSTLNFPTTDPRATGVLEPLGSDGKMWALYHSGRVGDRVQIIFDLSGYFSPATDEGGFTFASLGPVRMIDSIAKVGGASTLVTDVGESFQIAGRSGVPQDAIAVTGTLAIKDPTHGGYVALTSAEVTAATVTTSTLNFTATDPRATGVTIPLGTDGKMWALYHSGQTDDTVQIIFDLTGYFSPAADGATFHPLGPARIIDSRSSTGGATVLHSDIGEALQIAGLFGIPGDAVAVAGTLTVANQNRPGVVALTPTQATPETIGTSTLSFATTDPRATGLVESLGPDGKLWALFQSGRTGDKVNVIFDVTGYFSPEPEGGPQLMPAYFNNWMPNDALPKDSHGVVLVNYADGPQYNPVTIAQAAVRYYDHWLADATDDQKAADRTAMLAQITWLVANQTPDGRWLYYFRWGSQRLPWWSGMAEGMGISALLRAYSMTGDATYLPVIARARATFERSEPQHGVQTTLTYGRKYVVYQEYLGGSSQNVLNGWMFALIGLYEDAVYLGDPMAAFDVMSADRGIAAIRGLLPLYNTGNWSYYNLTSATVRGSWASWSYHNTHIAQLRFLSSVTGDHTLAWYAARFQYYVDSRAKDNIWTSADIADDPNYPDP